MPLESTQQVILTTNSKHAWMHHQVTNLRRMPHPATCRPHHRVLSAAAASTLPLVRTPGARHHLEGERERERAGDAERRAPRLPAGLRLRDLQVTHTHTQHIAGRGTQQG
jgi:hypothetical protein